MTADVRVDVASVRLRADVGQSTVPELQTLTDAVFTIVNYVSRTISDFPADDQSGVRSSDPPGARALDLALARYLDLALARDLDLALALARDLARDFVRADDITRDLVIALDLARDLDLALAGVRALDLDRVGDRALDLDYTLQRLRLTVERVVGGEQLAKSFARLQLLGDDLLNVLERLAVSGPPRAPARVRRMSFENPFELDLVQDVPAAAELAFVGGVFSGLVVILKIAFGSGPRERAEAGKLRAEEDAVRAGIKDQIGAEPPPMSIKERRARDVVSMYDWEIEIS